MKKNFFPSFFLIGFLSLTCQVVLLREFLLVFYGNEISIGIFLLFWMSSTAIGSFGLGSLIKENSSNYSYLVLSQLLISILFPLEIFLIKILKFLTDVPSSEIVKLPLMIFSSMFLLFPLCLILGFMFNLCSRIYDEEIKNNVMSISTVYLIESIGAISGGILYNFILVNNLDSFNIAYLVGFITLSITLTLIFHLRNSVFITKANFIFLTFISFLVIIFLFYGIFSPKQNQLSSISQNLIWKDYKFIDSENSKYGNITIVKDRESLQTSFFENGLYLFTAPDILPCEEAAHFSLLPHPSPNNVLLIGGGLSGTLNEIIKHPIKKIVYTELDPLLISMAKKYLPIENSKILKNKKVEIINTDGRFFVKNTTSTFDVIIINLPDPLTYQLNRFYTLEFFNEVNKILNQNGIFSIKIMGFENYISDEKEQYLASVKNTLSKIFLDIKIIPGQTGNFFLCSKNPGNLAISADSFLNRLKERNIQTKYVRNYYLYNSYMSGERISYINKKINESKNQNINTDFKPVCYYYNLIYWNSEFNPEYLSIFKKAFSLNIIWFLILILAVFIFTYFTKLKNSSRSAILLTVFCGGFSEILSEIVILLVFQSLYGYVYFKIGIIITSFMVGLSLGTYIAIRKVEQCKDAFLKLINIAQLALINSILLVIIFSIFKNIVLPVSIINILFPFLTITIGFLGGYQFPYAVAAYSVYEKDTGKISGLLYGIDLLGGCIGAILTNLVLVPILGIYETYIINIFIIVCVLIFLHKVKK